MVIYMTDLKCPYDGNTKNYIIPTGKWLKAIETLSTDDINTSGTVIISELLEKEKVLVKITTDKKNKLKEVNSKIKGLPNFVYTYCVIFCNDYLPVILQKKQFCNLQDKKYKVTIEIMKFYNGGSLTKYSNINFKIFKLILKQLTLAQINLFRRHGITHNDIHSGNILIHKHSKKIELNYGYLDKPIKIDTDYEFILSDYDKCMLFSPININDNSTEVSMNISDTIEDLMPSTLLFNIIRTINVLKERIDKNTNRKIIELDAKFQEKYQELYYNKEQEYLNIYLNSLNKNNTLLPFTEYIKKSSNNCLNYYNHYNEEIYKAYMDFLNNEQYKQYMLNDKEIWLQ